MPHKKLWILSKDFLKVIWLRFKEDRVHTIVILTNICLMQLIKSRSRMSSRRHLIWNCMICSISTRKQNSIYTFWVKILQIVLIWSSPLSTTILQKRLRESTRTPTKLVLSYLLQTKYLLVYSKWELRFLTTGNVLVRLERHSDISVNSFGF